MSAVKKSTRKFEAMVREESVTREWYMFAITLVFTQILMFHLSHFPLLCTKVTLSLTIASPLSLPSTLLLTLQLIYLLCENWNFFERQIKEYTMGKKYSFAKHVLETQTQCVRVKTSIKSGGKSQFSLSFLSFTANDVRRKIYTRL